MQHTLFPSEPIHPLLNRRFFVLRVFRIEHTTNSQKVLTTLLTYNPTHVFSLINTHLSHTSPFSYLPLLYRRPLPGVATHFFFFPCISHGGEIERIREVKEDGSSVQKQECQICNNNQVCSLKKKVCSFENSRIFIFYCFLHRHPYELIFM